MWLLTSCVASCCAVLRPTAVTVIALPSFTSVGTSSFTPNLNGAVTRSVQLDDLGRAWALQPVKGAQSSC